MSCNIYVPKIIFNICYCTRNIKKYYIFVGIVNNNIEKVLNKLENRKNLDKNDTDILKLNYKDEYKYWVLLLKNKIKIKFIYNSIRIDDNLYTLKQKIFLYLSDNNKYYLPNNIELWYTNNSNKNIILGYYYNENIEPHIYNNEIKQPYNYHKDILNTKDNYMCLYDIIDIYDIKDNTIYYSDIESEIEYIKKMGKNIDDNNIKKYLKYYFPVYNTNIDKQEIKKTLDKLTYVYENENKVLNMIDNNNINLNIGSCNIMTIQLDIKSENNIDLYPIFDHIKDNILDINTPFIKYNDHLIENPFNIISKEAINNKRINIEQVKNWVIGLKNVESIREYNKLQIKRYISDYNNEHKYSTIELTQDGKIIIKVSYKADYKADFTDIKKVIDNCSELITDINKLKYNLSIPSIDINGNKIKLNNIKIKYMNIIIPFNNKKPINFKELKKYSKNFQNFIVEPPDETLYENSIKFRYKRVSGFINMDNIMTLIDKLKESNIEDIYIIKKIVKDYDKTQTEAKSLLDIWKKKYSFFKNSKIKTMYKTGIETVITNNNIELKGITDLYQIIYTYSFFKIFLYGYFNNLFINKKQTNINIDDYLLNELKNIKINYNVDYEYNNINIDINKININEIEEYNDYENKGENILKTSTGRILASNNEIGKDIQLNCNDAIPEKDTCRDFCNDTSYFLRRLQRYDNKLFKFDLEKGSNQSQYSRDCQRQNQRQPVVLSYDPETNNKIKKDSYTYSIKYSSDPNNYENWYICPKIWCPYCEIPISEKEIDNKTIRKKDKCLTGQCPYGEHQVFIRNSNQIYPSFLSEDKHPLGYCLPCCFAVPHNKIKSRFYQKFSKCLGINVNNHVQKDNVIYILGKAIPIDRDRYGLLPNEVAKILNSKLDTGYLEYNSGYIRKGIKHEKYNSFLSAICDIINKNGSITIEKIKLNLIELLDEKLFRSLYHGNLFIKFNDNINNPLDNFKKYLLSEKIYIDHTFLWDLLQRPGILFKNGINIFIFEDNKLLCPIGEEISEYYNIKLDNIILLKHKHYYEPIYYLQGTGKTANISNIYPPNKIEINNLLNIVNYWCKKKRDINWDKVLLDNIKNYNLRLDNHNIDIPLSLNNTINKIKNEIANNNLSKDYDINYTLIDSYNKIYAIILKNKLFIPVYPSKINTNYKYIEKIDESLYLNYKDTIKLLNNINNVCNFNNKPIAKILSLKKDKVVAIHTYNNRIIPVKNSPIIRDEIKISNYNMYSDADDYLKSKIEMLDNRIEYINKQNYEDETYNRIKFEFSKYINEHKEYINDIENIINSNTNNIDIKRNKLKNLLLILFNKLVSIKSNDIDINFYVKRNKRSVCHNKDKLSCMNDPHCVYDGDCKVFMHKDNLIKNKDNKIYYLSMITEELLRYKNKRDDILYQRIPYIINRNKIDISNKYYIINTYYINEINNLLNIYFSDKNKIQIDNRKLYEETKTKHIGFNSSKYTNFNISIINENLQNDLSIYWLKIFGNNYKIQKNNDDSIFISICHALNEKKNNMNYNNINYTKERVKDDICNYIIKNNSNKIIQYNNYYKFPRNISTINDLIKEIKLDYYTGCDVDIKIMSIIYKINIIVLHKRLKKKGNNFDCHIIDTNENIKYVFLYKISKLDKYIYDIIKKRDKFLFNINDINPKIFDKVINNCEICNECYIKKI